MAELTEPNAGGTARIWTKTCAQCGATIQSRARNTQYCPDCKKARDRKKHADYNRAHYQPKPKPEPMACVQCGKVFQPMRSNRKFCSPACGKKYYYEHLTDDELEETQEQKRRNTAYFRSRGKCPHCQEHRPLAEGKKFCAECLEKARKHRNAKMVITWQSREAMRKKYHERKAKGICVACGAKPAIYGQTMCPGCAAKKNEREKKRYHDHKAT